MPCTSPARGDRGRRTAALGCGPRSLGDDHDIEPAGEPACHGDRRAVGVLVQAIDLLAEFVGDGAGGGVDEHPGEGASQDLDLGGRPGGVTDTGGELGEDAVVVDEPKADLARRPVCHGIFDTRAAQNLSARATDVVVLTGGSQGLGALDDRHTVARFRQPVRGRRPGDAGTGDDGVIWTID